MLDLTTGKPELFHADNFHAFLDDFMKSPTWRKGMDSPCQDSGLKARELAFEQVIYFINDTDGFELVGTNIMNALSGIVWVVALAF